MSERDEYQPGVPCWVDILVADPAPAMDFYGQLFDWEFGGPGPGGYYEARLGDRHVAGVGASPEGVPAVWNTYVSVASADDTSCAEVLPIAWAMSEGFRSPVATARSTEA